VILGFSKDDTLMFMKFPSQRDSEDGDSGWGRVLDRGKNDPRRAGARFFFCVCQMLRAGFLQNDSWFGLRANILMGRIFLILHPGFVLGCCKNGP
jgi:hypothetical protein